MSPVTAATFRTVAPAPDRSWHFAQVPRSTERSLRPARPFTPAQVRGWADALRRLAALEYALIDACHSAADTRWETDRARLAARASAAQVHLFDIGSALRALGADSLSFSRCVRLAMSQSGRPDEILARIEREYRRLVAQREVPASLHSLVCANLAEHLGLDHVDRVAVLAA